MLNTQILWQSAVAILLVLLAMYVGVRLVRFAATFCLALLLTAGCVFAIVQIATREWQDWPSVVFYSVITGFSTALLAIPLLPFTNFWKKNQ